MDTIAPTAERLRHGYGWDVPERSQTVNRVAYRQKTAFEDMERRGHISYAHLQAAEKLEKHYRGASGVKVGSGEGSAETDTEFPQIYHGQMVAIAWQQITRDEKAALTDLIEGNCKVPDIGRRVGGFKDYGRAEAYGRSLVMSGLERLACHWGFRQREP